MKSVALFSTVVLAFTSSITSFAQQDTVKKQHFGEKLVSWNQCCFNSNSKSCCLDSVPHYKKQLITSFLDLDLGFNMLINKGNGDGFYDYDPKMSATKPLPIYVHLGLVNQSLNVYNYKLRFNYGLALDLRNYKFNNNNLVLNADSNKLTGYLDQTQNYKKSKLMTGYVTMPLLMSFRTRPDNISKSFNLDLGIEPGYLFNSHTKMKTSNNKVKKNHDDFYLNPWQVNLVGKIGYGNWNIVCRYGLTPMFKNNVGPQGNTLTIGLQALMY